MASLLQKLIPGYRKAASLNAALRAELAERAKAQERLERLVGQVRDYAIILLDPEGRILTWNVGAERLKGYEAEEIIGRHFSCFYPPEDAATGKPAMELTLARAYGTYQEDGWRVRKDGSRFLAHVVITPVQGAGGELIGYAKVTRDITMQKDSEAELQTFARELEEAVEARTQDLHERDARLRGFILHATSAIAFKDADGRYLLINPRMETLLARGPEEILGRTDEDLLPEARAIERRLKEQKVMGSGQGLEEEERWTHADGTLHDYLTQTFPLLDAEGQNYGLGIISTDITERKQADQARLQSQKLESLGVLAGGIAHDFNNLLGAILGNLGLAQMDVPAQSAVRKRLDTLESLVTKATNLTRQMLAYSGKGAFEIKAMSLNEMVQEMTHLLSITISKKVSIRYALDPSLPAIEADASQLQQVVMNLVLNASDAIGDRPGTITVRTSCMSADVDYLKRTFHDQSLKPGTFVCLEVADDGCGMDRATQQKIFEPFFTTKATGRGLGLSAIRGIVNGHGGGIRVYSEPGRGTTFKLLFPATLAGLAQAPAEEPAKVFRGSGTILVADDEESIRTMAAGILGQMGFDALLAEDGMEALLLFETHKEDIRLIIMDLTMPNMDGAETFAALRARGHTTPVVLSSGFNEKEAVTRFQGDGLAGFLQKPYKVKNFMDVVKTALEREVQSL